MSGGVVKQLKNLFDEKMNCMAEGMGEILEKISPNFTPTRLSRCSVYADPNYDFNNCDTEFDMLIGVAFAKEKEGTVVVLGYEFNRQQKPTHVIVHELPVSFTGRIYQLPESLGGETKVCWFDFIKNYMPSRIRKDLTVVIGSISEEIRSAIVAQPAEPASQEKNTAQPKQKKTAKSTRDKNYVAGKGEDSGTGSEGDLCESDKEIAGQSTSFAAPNSGQSKPKKTKQDGPKTSKKRTRPKQAEHQEAVSAVATPISEHQLLAQAIKDWPAHLTTNPETLAGVGYMLFGPDMMYRAMRQLDERMRRSVMDERGRARVAFEFQEGCYYTVMRNTEACMCLAGYIKFKTEMFQPGGCFDRPIVEVLEQSEVETKKRKVNGTEEASTSTTFKTHFFPLYPRVDCRKPFKFQVGVVKLDYPLHCGVMEMTMVIGFELEEMYWMVPEGTRTYEGICEQDRFTPQEVEDLVTYAQPMCIRYLSELLLDRIIIPREGGKTLRQVLMEKNAKQFVDLTQGLTKDWKKFSKVLESRKTDPNGHQVSVVESGCEPRGERVEDHILCGEDAWKKHQGYIFASEDRGKHQKYMNIYALGCFQALHRNPTNPVIFGSCEQPTPEQRKHARTQMHRRSRLPIQVTVKKASAEETPKTNKEFFDQFKEVVHDLQVFPKIEKKDVGLLLVPVGLICEHNHFKKDHTTRHNRPWYECKITGNFIHTPSCSTCFNNPFANPFVGPLCALENEGVCRDRVQNTVFPATIGSMLCPPHCGQDSSINCMEKGLLNRKQQASVFVGVSDEQEKTHNEVEEALQEFQATQGRILEKKVAAAWKFIREHATEQPSRERAEPTKARFRSYKEDDEDENDM